MLECADMHTQQFKERLEEEKGRLARQMQEVGRKNPAVPDDFEARPTQTGSEPDLADQAGVIQSYEENEGVLRDLEARYDQILAALARIEAGTFGKCAVGGEAIEPERLEADPAAATCLAHLR